MFLLEGDVWVLYSDTYLSCFTHEATDLFSEMPEL